MDTLPTEERTFSHFRLIHNVKNQRIVDISFLTSRCKLPEHRHSGL